MKYKVTQTIFDRANTPRTSSERLVYADLTAPRFRVERSYGLDLPVARASYHAIAGSTVSVQDFREGVILDLHTETEVEVKAGDESIREATRRELAGGRAPRRTATLRPAAGGPAGGTMLENLEALKRGGDARAVRERRDGRDLLRYRVADAKATTTLWADAATGLPVRLETVIVDASPTNPLDRWVFSDLEWDPAVDLPGGVEALFRTSPPEGYKFTDLTRPGGHR